MGDVEGAVSGPPPSFSPFPVDDAFHTPQLRDALDHIDLNCRRGHRFLQFDPEHNGRTMTICGGGPSIRGYVEDIKARFRSGRHDIIAINDTYDWLAERGVVARLFAMMEIDPWPKTFLEHANNLTTYYMADMAHPTGYDRLKGFDVVVWHPWLGEGEEKVWRPHDPEGFSVCGGEAISIRAINLGLCLGYRNFEMFGVDGCYSGTDSHVYTDRRMPEQEVWCAGRTFRAPYYLARQANDLRRFCANFHFMFRLRCFGDGLVQHMHRTAFPKMYV